MKFINPVKALCSCLCRAAITITFLIGCVTQSSAVERDLHGNVIDTSAQDWADKQKALRDDYAKHRESMGEESQTAKALREQKQKDEEVINEKQSRVLKEKQERQDELDKQRAKIAFEARERQRAIVGMKIEEWRQIWQRNLDAFAPTMWTAPDTKFAEGWSQITNSAADDRDDKYHSNYSEILLKSLRQKVQGYGAIDVVIRELTLPEKREPLPGPRVQLMLLQIFEWNGSGYPASDSELRKYYDRLQNTAAGLLNTSVTNGLVDASELLPVLRETRGFFPPKGTKKKKDKNQLLVRSEELLKKKILADKKSTEAVRVANEKNAAAQAKAKKTKDGSP